MSVSPGRWPRDAFAEAVFESRLRPVERLVALVYADHARDSAVAWVSYDRLVQRTGLARSTAAAAVRALVRGGWLVEVEPARQHKSTRYRLTAQQSDSRTPDQSSSPAVDASSPAVDASSPAVDASSPAVGPDLSTDHKTNHTTPRVEDEVIVTPEDRDPTSDANLVDRLRGYGVAWAAIDIQNVHRRLTKAYGGDAAAAGAAQGALVELAKRPKTIQNLAAYMSSFTSDEQLITLRPAAKPTGLSYVRPVCSDDRCRGGWIGHDDEERPIPCATCRPHGAALVAARRAS